MITIVLPVYNTPTKALDRCLESLKNQTNQNFYAIIVDDGSDSKIAQYLDLICKSNSNFSVIHKDKNTGLPDTKNFGVNATHTKYIAFCDSDDEYSFNFVDSCYKYIEKYKFDLLIGNIIYKPNWKSQKLINEIKLFFGKDETAEIKSSMFELIPRKTNYNINVSTCGKLYKTEIVKNILFDSNVTFGEDQLFNKKYLDKINSCLVVSDIYYIYYQNDFSMTHNSIRTLHFDNYKKFWDEMYKIRNNEDGELATKFRTFYLRLLNGYINRTYAANFNISLADGTKKVRNAISHPLLVSAINEIKPFSKYITFLDSFNVVLLKNKLYFLYFLEKRMIYILKINKDKI